MILIQLFNYQRIKFTSYRNIYYPHIKLKGWKRMIKIDSDVNFHGFIFLSSPTQVTQTISFLFETIGRWQTHIFCTMNWKITITGVASIHKKNSIDSNSELSQHNNFQPGHITFTHKSLSINHWPIIYYWLVLKL